MPLASHLSDPPWGPCSDALSSVLRRTQPSLTEMDAGLLQEGHACQRWSSDSGRQDITRSLEAWPPQRTTAGQTPRLSLGADSLLPPFPFLSLSSSLPHLLSFATYTHTHTQWESFD